MKQKKKYENVLAIKGIDNSICVLVGNKCDLNEKERVVSKKEAEEFAQSKGIPFFETSVKEPLNIKESFTWAVQEYLEKIKNNRKESKGIGCPCILF